MIYSKATLDMCERHVAQGERHIAEQIARMDRLEAQGLRLTGANALLRTLEYMQARHIEHRDQVKAVVDRPRSRQPL